MNCPNCDTNPWGKSYSIKLSTVGGNSVDGVVCGECGTVFVEDPHEEFS